MGVLVTVGLLEGTRGHAGMAGGWLFVCVSRVGRLMMGELGLGSGCMPCLGGFFSSCNNSLYCDCVSSGSILHEYRIDWGYLFLPLLMLYSNHSVSLRGMLAVFGRRSSVPPCVARCCQTGIAALGCR